MSGPGSVPYLQSAAVIANQSLDMIGTPEQVIGDVTDGTDVSEAVRRNYGQLLRQLLRTAHWNFARKYAPLTLLGDATGQTPNVSLIVEPPWQYAYAWPIDGVQGRWMPFTWLNGQSGINSAAIPENPTFGVVLNPPGTSFCQPQVPARFLVSSSPEYPIEVGSIPWDQLPDLQRTEGVGPTSRKIILTNCCEARFVYTRFVPVIEEWDSLFRQSMVALLALTLIPVAIKDPKTRIAERDRMIAIAKNTIADARVANGNESTTSATTDHTPAWITRRNQAWGAYGAGGGGTSFGGIGYDWIGWESLSWGGGTF